MYAEAKAQGKIRHIGVTTHKLGVAKECIESGLYETLQYPLSYISSEKELELVQLCKEHNMGFIAMKGLAGGLINNSGPLSLSCPSSTMYFPSGAFRK